MSPRAPICVVIGSLDIGGTERHLCQVLPVLKRRGWSVDVVTLTHRGKLAALLEDTGIPVNEPAGAVRVRAWPGVVRRPATLSLATSALARRFRKSPGGITHFFLPAAYLLGMAVSMAAGRPGPLLMSRRSLNLYQRKYLGVATLERWLHRRVDKVLANSAATARQLQDEEGVPAERVELIYNGIDLAPFAGDLTARRALARFDLGLADDVLVIALVANLIPYKGHVDLFEALARVRCRLPRHWRLLAIGRDHDMRRNLEARAASLGIGNHVLWVGERDDVPDLLLASDLGVLVSYEEGFSNAVLEGMAAALPMVVTDVGGNAEAVLDGETGFVVPAKTPQPLADAITTLAEDTALARSLGAAGRARVERYFSLDACADGYERVYAALSAQHSV